jgi:hypothetical protein
VKLWLLKPVHIEGDRRWGWDCAHGFVVRADSETDARLLAAGESGDELPTAWLKPELSTCEELTAEGGAEVVLRDFHAG